MASDSDVGTTHTRRTIEATMKKLKVSLRYCYGIPKLDCEFDFSSKRQYVVYAPNGVMKSSLARTFKDFSEGRASSDRIYPERQSQRTFLDERGRPLAPENIFVVEPYDASYKSNRMSTLLVNENLRKRYEEVRADIDEKSRLLESALSASSGLKKGASEKFATDVAADPKAFETALGRLADEVARNPYAHLSDINYASVFNDKTEPLLTDPTLQKSISDYMAAYDRLTSESTFFKKGVFNHNNASEVAKSLKANGFFRAEHSVYVGNRDVREEIKTEEDLEKFITQEKNTILSDTELRAAFEKIDKQLIKNADTREFRNYIAQNDKILPELVNPSRLKSRLWASYLSANESTFRQLRDSYGRGREEIAGIVALASEESTRWRAVIDEFNDRFSVPFVVTIENQPDVILKAEAPSVRFRFKDRESEEVPVAESDLLQVLSNGERRALYLLNVIFEVFARKDAGIETLFILDDIADSFDYKNKYAIVEYLSDISEEPKFRQLILTHNFDLFRTLSSRLDLSREHKLHAIRNEGEVCLVEETYQKNPFITWRQRLAHAGNDDVVIATVPFLRNIAEYTGRENTEGALTRFLHVKEGSDTLTLQDLEAPINELMAGDGIVLPQHERRFFDLLFERAQHHAAGANAQGLELEAKIVLSIAIRIKAEEFMIREIDEPALVAEIESNQTFKLMKLYREKGLGDREQRKLLKQVHLMTPENIHLNSFMFEPILDMSSEHLKRLFTSVTALLQPAPAAVAA